MPKLQVTEPRNRLLGDMPKIGIRPTIDGRLGGVREGLEEQTMGMARRVAAFLTANLLKIVDGGWFPLLLGVCLMIVMLTWRRGTRILFQKTRRLEVPLDDLVKRLDKKPPHRVPGTAIFLTGDPASARAGARGASR